MRDQIWLSNPPDGTPVCGGFDGSENDDWTGIKLETIDGHLFTPRYGPDRLPAIWNPARWPGHRIPRDQVNEAWDEIARRYKLHLVYADPGFHDGETDYSTEIEQWDRKHGPGVFVEWPTNILSRMYPALRRFEADLKNRGMTHDGCPITATHIGNARKIAKGDRYFLGKPAQNQKIDAAMFTVLAHEAAADARANGWGEQDELPPLVFSM